MVVNFAKIGMIIGHEMMHSVDDQGRERSENGTLTAWWDQKTIKEFNKRTKCLM